MARRTPKLISFVGPAGKTLWVREDLVSHFMSHKLGGVKKWSSFVDEEAEVIVISYETNICKGEVTLHAYAVTRVLKIGG